jgi:ribosomal protein S12 methylthiotransferase accessory factor
VVITATDWDLVQVFRPFPSCPGVVFARVAARSDSFGPMEASGGAPVVVGSAAGADEADVAIRARSELVERVSNILAGRAVEREGTIVASYDELRRAGTAALDPAAWRPTPCDARHVPVLWVVGRSLLDGREVLVPAGAAFLRHRPPTGCAVAIRAGSAGVAAHATEPAAIRHAALEVLERDLVARSWSGAGPARPADPPTWPPSLAEALATLGLEVSTLVLAGPSCLVACAHMAGRAEQSFGARCVVSRDPPNISHGFERAVYEALMVRWSMGTGVARRAWADLGQRPGSEGPRHALEHALWTFHRQDSLGHWLARAAESDVGHGEGDLSAEGALAAAIADHTGEEVAVVDSTVAGVGADGVVVVRVVAPGAERLGSEAPDGRLPHPFG